jgi:hypothetical protein
LKEKWRNKLTRKEQRGLYRRDVEKLLTYYLNKRRARFSSEAHFFLPGMGYLSKCSF